jgi:hypothetical protein
MGQHETSRTNGQSRTLAHVRGAKRVGEADIHRDTPMGGSGMSDRPMQR